jgi:hypothetical protein
VKITPCAWCGAGIEDECTDDCPSRYVQDVTRHAFVHFENDEGFPFGDWLKFCGEHDIRQGSGNVFYKGGRHGVECIFGAGRGPAGSGNIPEDQVVHEVVFLTQWGGPRLKDLAEIARAFWVKFGGALYAETQVRALIAGPGDGAA